MKLEIITKIPHERISNTPIVLIHGAWHAAWCWEGNFLDYFPSRGWETHAVSLRGHGQSDGASTLHSTSIEDYVADIKQVIDALPCPPILVAHSMGGFVVQKYLEHHAVAGAVLLAPVPHTGNGLCRWRMTRKYPFSLIAAVLTRNPYLIMRKPEMFAWACYSDKIAPDVLAQHHKMLGQEAYKATIQLAGPRGLPKPSENTSPISVIGGELDRMFSVQEIQQTAKAFGVEAKIFTGMPHSLMAVPGWEKVAEWIEQWAQQLISAEPREAASTGG